MKHNKFILSMVIILSLIMAIQTTVFAGHSFEDVVPNSWYSDAVDYVYNNGLMSGTGANQFAPEANMSRAMLVTVLYSMEGKPVTTASEPFADVGKFDWYYSPVVWAYKNGIVAGTSANAFSPDSNITREQMVAIFAKYAAYKGLKTPATANINGYSDRNAISSYAVDAFKWAVSAGIISGTSATTLGPQGTATRAQCAVILRQFVRWTDNNGTVVVTPKPTPGGLGDTELPPF